MVIPVDTVLTDMGRMSKEVWGRLYAVVAADDQGSPSLGLKQFLPFHPHIQDCPEFHNTWDRR